MNCEDIQERLSMMLDEELSVDERALVMEHIAACPECMKVYEAFSAISASLGDLEDVPEGLTENVMRQVRAKTAAPKRKRYFTGVLGMAACLALVLLAGRTLSSPKGEMNMAPRSNDASAPMVESAAPYSVYGNDSLDAQLMSFDVATVYQNSIASANGAQEAPTDGISEANKEHTFTSTEGSDLPLAANTMAPESLDTLLAVSSPAEYGNYERISDYTVVFFGDEETYSIDVWVEGERLYCQDAAGNAYYAKGTYAQLLTLMDE